MSQTLRRPTTMAEFLEWEERQEGRYEFDGHRIVAMNGGTLAHSIICGNGFLALQTRLRGKRCRAHGGSLKVEVAGAIRYPDAFVVCTRLQPAALVVQDPVVLFEVLSPSSAIIDLTEKHDEYRDTPSVRRYVILRQDRAHATVFVRDGQDWTRDGLTEGATLSMPEIGLEIPLAEFYEDVAFGPT